MNRAVSLNKLRTALKVTAGATAFFGTYCLLTGEERFYRGIVMPTIRWLPAETSHKLAVFACKHKLLPPGDIEEPQNLETNFFGKKISNPIGIAAGFDKNGEAIEGLFNLGFGFVEIGSVTPQPQPGNPSPRVFRLSSEGAIINRYGFNSEGHERVFKRVSNVKSDPEFNGVIGVNLGKNKTSKRPRADYVKGVETFGPIADYLVINVSSPNTPGLHHLQKKDNLEKLLKVVVRARNNLPENNTVPIFLKLSPDLTKDELKDIAYVITNNPTKVDGLIVTNTTLSRDNLSEITPVSQEEGGLSGAPLRLKSTQLVADMYYLTNGKIPIIGVGGVTNGEDAFEKIEAGASYVQIYTALVYEGPMVVNRIKQELSQLMEEKGYKDINKVVGVNNKQYRSEDIGSNIIGKLGKMMNQ